MQPDAELVKAVLSGEKQVFAVLVKRYERAVRGVAINVLKDYHIAADVSQNAFVAAYQQLDRLRDAGAFGPWLVKIAHNCAVDAVRKRLAEKSLQAAAQMAVGNSNGHLDEDKLRILAVVMKLPESEKQVVMLRYFSGHNVRDIAEIVGRSVGTVTKQLSRAHKRLQKILERAENE